MLYGLFTGQMPFLPPNQQRQRTEGSHTSTPDTAKLSCLCRVRFGGANWIPDNSRLSPTENLKSEHVDSNCPIHVATPDTTQTGLFCRDCCGGVN